MHFMIFVNKTEIAKKNVVWNYIFRILCLYLLYCLYCLYIVYIYIIYIYIYFFSFHHSAIFVHGFAVDENCLKMSKSIGNVINPEEILQGGSNLEKNPIYGVDVLRYYNIIV